MSINILLISPYNINSFGGVQNQIESIKSYLNNKTQYDCKVAGPNSSDFDIGNTINVPFNGSVSPVCLFPNKQVLKNAIRWSDVIHVHEPFVPLTFWKMPKHKNYIFTHHASLSLFICFLLKILYFFIGRKGLSTHVSDLAKNNALALSSSTNLIPNMFSLNKDVKFEQNKHILFIGRDEKRKNLSLYKKYVKNYYDSSYKYSAITNKTIDNNFINTFINPSDSKKNKILQESDIYVALNTHGESFGITLIEAINAGNIVISSDLKAFKSLLGHTGLYFQNNSLKSLNHLIEKIKISNIPNIWEEQNKQIQKYDIKKNMDKFISLYLSF